MDLIEGHSQVLGPTVQNSRYTSVLMFWGLTCNRLNQKRDPHPEMFFTTSTTLSVACQLGQVRGMYNNWPFCRAPWCMVNGLANNTMYHLVKQHLSFSDDTERILEISVRNNLNLSSVTPMTNSVSGYKLCAPVVTASKTKLSVDAEIHFTPFL